MLSARMLVALAVLASVTPRAQAQRDSTLLRPTEVTVRISNDADALYNGVYHAVGISTSAAWRPATLPHLARPRLPLSPRFIEGIDGIERIVELLIG